MNSFVDNALPDDVMLSIVIPNSAKQAHNDDLFLPTLLYEATDKMNSP